MGMVLKTDETYTKGDKVDYTTLYGVIEMIQDVDYKARKGIYIINYYKDSATFILSKTDNTVEPVFSKRYEVTGQDFEDHFGPATLNLKGMNLRKSLYNHTNTSTDEAGKFESDGGVDIT